MAQTGRFGYPVGRRADHYRGAPRNKGGISQLAASVFTPAPEGAIRPARHCVLNSRLDPDPTHRVRTDEQRGKRGGIGAVPQLTVPVVAPRIEFAIALESQ